MALLWIVTSATLTSSECFFYQIVLLFQDKTFQNYTSMLFGNRILHYVFVSHSNVRPYFEHFLDFHEKKKIIVYHNPCTEHLYFVDEVR